MVQCRWVDRRLASRPPRDHDGDLLLDVDSLLQYTDISTEILPGFRRICDGVENRLSASVVTAFGRLEIALRIRRNLFSGSFQLSRRTHHAEWAYRESARDQPF